MEPGRLPRPLQGRFETTQMCPGASSVARGVRGQTKRPHRRDAPTFAQAGLSADVRRIFLIHPVEIDKEKSAAEGDGRDSIPDAVGESGDAHYPLCVALRLCVSALIRFCHSKVG